MTADNDGQRAERQQKPNRIVVNSPSNGNHRDQSGEREAEGSANIHIPRIPKGTTEKDLSNLFSELFPRQKIVSVGIRTRQGRDRYAFVQFAENVLLPANRQRVNCPWSDGFEINFQYKKKEKNDQIEKNGSAQQVDKGFSRVDLRDDEVDSSRSPQTGLTNIYVGNLPRRTSDQNLIDLFSDLCPERNVIHVQRKRKSYYRLYAFVGFDGDVGDLLGPSAKRTIPCPWSTDVELELGPAILQPNSPRVGDGNGIFGDEIKQTKSLATRERMKSQDTSSLAKAAVPPQPETSSGQPTSSLMIAASSGSDRKSESKCGKIFIRNVPKNTQNNDISRLFRDLCPELELRRILISKNSGAKKFAFVYLPTVEDVELVLEGTAMKKVRCPWANDFILELEAGKKKAVKITDPFNDEESHDKAKVVENEITKLDEGMNTEAARHLSEKTISDEKSSELVREASDATEREKMLEIRLSATNLLLETAICESATLKSNLEIFQNEAVSGRQALHDVKQIQEDLAKSKDTERTLRNKIDEMNDKIAIMEKEASEHKSALNNATSVIETLRSELSNANTTIARGDIQLIEHKVQKENGKRAKSELKATQAKLKSEKKKREKAESEAIQLRKNLSGEAVPDIKPVEAHFNAKEGAGLAGEPCEVEVELLQSMFSPEELWVGESIILGDSDPRPCVHRRLLLPIDDDTGSIPVELVLTVPVGYPDDDSAVLSIESSMHESNTAVDAKVKKCAENAMCRLVAVCRAEAEMHAGEESIFFVMQTADAWVINDWNDFLNRGLSSPKKSSLQMMLQE